MTSTIKVLYPDLSTEAGPAEILNSGEQLNITTFFDQRSEVEVESADEPVTITGGQFDDTITGGQFNDTITGGDGNDLIDGGDGDDVLNIGSGDTVFGGGGTDVFHFDLSQDIDLANPPIISDYSEEDELTVSNVEDSSAAAVYDVNTGTVLLGDRKLVNIGKGLNPSTVDLMVNDAEASAINPINSAETTIYRFYDSSKGTHFYTVDEVEKDYVLENLDNYDFEGESYNIIDPITGSEIEQVYRFFNSSTGVHLYTTSEVERDSIIDTLDNFTYEGAKFYAYETEVEGSMPIHRFYEPTLGVHFYTPSEAEKDSVMENLDNYTYEGIAYYALPLDSDMSDM